MDDLDGVLDRLIDEGVTVDPKSERYDFGRFEGSAGSPTEKEIVSSFGSPSQLVDAELARWVPISRFVFTHPQRGAKSVPVQLEMEKAFLR